MEDSTWEQLKLDPNLIAELLKAGYKQPTPIQAEAIPVAIQGRDLIASAKTGSGKTAGFALPIIQKLIGRRGTYALILSPTRELALQTHQAIVQFGEPVGVKSTPLIGGIDFKQDLKALAKPNHILIGTPGRVCDHLDRGNLWLEYIELFVLDEADRMLDMGFSRELNRIVAELPKSRQTLLFSATMPPSIQSLANKTLNNPARIAIGSATTVAQSIEHELCWADERDKKRLLFKLLHKDQDTIIIFVRTKDGAAKLWRSIHAEGFHDSTYLSSNRRQSDREDALTGFKDGRFRIMVATDVAGRGIHVDDVGHVINFDFPRESEDYIHRVGRTGRKKASGRATSFVTTRDLIGVRRTEGLLKKVIPTSPMSLIDRPDGKRAESPRDTKPSKPSARKSEPRRGSRDRAERSDSRDRAPRSETRDRPQRSDSRERSSRAEPRSDSRARSDSRDRDSRDRDSRDRAERPDSRDRAPRSETRDRPQRSDSRERSSRAEPRSNSRVRSDSKDRDSRDRDSRDRADRPDSRDRAPRSETRDRPQRPDSRERSSRAEPRSNSRARSDSRDRAEGPDSRDRAPRSEPRGETRARAPRSESRRDPREKFPRSESRRDATARPNSAESSRSSRNDARRPGPSSREDLRTKPARRSPRSEAQDESRRTSREEPRSNSRTARPASGETRTPRSSSRHDTEERRPSPEREQKTSSSRRPTPAHRAATPHDEPPLEKEEIVAPPPRYQPKNEKEILEPWNHLPPIVEHDGAEDDFAITDETPHEPIAKRANAATAGTKKGGSRSGAKRGLSKSKSKSSSGSKSKTSKRPRTKPTKKS